MKLDLKKFERKITVRQLRVEDFDAVVALQLKCFPKMDPWTKEQFESQIQTFPEGQIAVEYDGKLIASSSSLMLDYSNYSDWHDWKLISGDGSIRNHDPAGDTLYGIEIMVDPSYQGMKLARRIYEARKLLCRDKNIARMIVGGRIPGYAKKKDKMTAHEYVERVIRKRLVDPVLTAQLANGFLLRQLIPDYLPVDEDSAGYATFLEWPNLDHVPSREPRYRRSVYPIRVGVVQYEMREVTTFEEFERQCRFYVDVGSDAKADFLLFPELFTLQLLSLVHELEPGRAARELAEFTPRYIELFQKLAVQFNVNIVGGSQFTVENERLLNVSYLFRRDGTLATQPKLHVTPNERRWWGVEPGEKLEVFETDRGPIAVMVCYDIEFPELSRIAAQKGARLVFVPFNTHDRTGYMRVRVCAQARCIENHIYVVTAGCVGNLPFVDNADIHFAQSGIFTPSDVTFARDGVATEASPNIETVLVHDLDMEALRRHRLGGTVQNWLDRRTDLYRVRWTEGGQSQET